MTTRQNAHQLALKAKGVRQKSFRFPQKVWERLSALAAERGLSEAAVVRALILATAPE